ncbi:MAG: hypothetical protein DRP82_00960 [Planctomycetota bacterium]|nr:MAG: hypothetical protein DRP82_00960 [Planctomycetota bacterium]
MPNSLDIPHHRPLYLNPQMEHYMEPPEEKCNAESSTQPKRKWEGAEGAVSAWLMSNPLIRKIVTLFVGNYVSAFTKTLAAHISGNETVLDVGCGSGFFSILVARRLKHGNAICLDRSRAMLLHLAKQAKRRGLQRKIHPVQSDALSLAVKSASVDVVITNFVLHELPSPRKALLEMARVMRRGGLLIITDFAPGSWIARHITAAHEQACKLFTADELRRLLTDVGFVVDAAIRQRNFIFALCRK